jgi:ubiquinone/menaquinone biosynthesis C-methylase UbiE/DNA-binding transcriptional ArsR family regulator
MDRTAASPPLLAWMAALADVTRARILRLVERHELTVAELCAVLQLPQSTVSRHLKVLADEAWVAARSEGTSRLYRLAVDGLDGAARRLWGLLREQTAATAAAAQDDHRLQTILTQRQSRSQEFFTSVAGQWDRVRREMFGDRFDLHALLGLLPDDWVVGDLGCGTGDVTAALAPFVRQVIGVDRSRPMLKAAAKRLARYDNVDLRQGELQALPIDDAALDAATIGLVLHHTADPLAVLREVARVVRPGGRLLVIDMLAHDHHDYQQTMGHVWLGFEPAQLDMWCTTAGFEAVRIRPLPPAPKVTGPALLVASARRTANLPKLNGHPRRTTA